MHLHLDAVTGPTGVTGARQADGGAAVARVTGIDRPGARIVPVVERWLRGLRPDARITVTPVVDLTDHIAVDAYEVPTRLAAQVEHRDLTCRFPWCPRTGASGRLDKANIHPYRFTGPDGPASPGGPGEQGGASTGRPPPGQTSTSNLAQLCRFHHRVKTHGGWTYHLTHDTVFTWTSPLGRRYTVDEHGTRPVP